MSDQEFNDYVCPHCAAPVSFPANPTAVVQECPKCCGILILPKEKGQPCEPLPRPIRTARLLLRPLDFGDQEDLLDLMSHEEAFRYIDWSPLNEGEVHDWLHNQEKLRLTQPGGNLCLGIQVGDPGKVVGFVSLYFTEADCRQAGFTMMVHPGYCKRGYGVEALRALLDFSFKSLRLHRVSVSNDSRNVAALRMIEKAGMRREGEFLKDQIIRDEWIDTIWHAILDVEFAKALENQQNKLLPIAANGNK